MTRTSDTPSPADIIRITPAPDDAGAQTADRYEWQSMMATADALSLYFTSLDDDGLLNPQANASIICEHHEDWVLIEGLSSEIVSAKHREASRAPFKTYRQLLNEGGVFHLYQRWVALNASPTCRLVTTSGLADDGARVASTCSVLRENPNAIDPMTTSVVSDVTKLMMNMPGSAVVAVSEVRAFLRSLAISDGQPRRDHLPDMVEHRFGRPVAERLGCPDGGQAVWQAALSLVRVRMRAAGPSIGGSLPTVLASPCADTLTSRTLTLADIDVAVRFGVRHVNGYAPLPRVVKANRMAIKMARGGCSDNAIERADELRLQYRRYVRAIQSQPSTWDQRGLVTNVLLRAIDEATRIVRDDSTEWGDALWVELDRRFRGMEGMSDVHGLSSDLLLGGLSELANECRAWFTDRFDVKAELRRLREGAVIS